MRRADLTGSDMRGVFLTAADLRKADLTGADLYGANVEDVLYNCSTTWPVWFRPASHGAVETA